MLLYLEDEVRSPDGSEFYQYHLTEFKGLRLPHPKNPPMLRIIWEENLGKGEFGEVYKGTLQYFGSTDSTVDVAVKVAKGVLMIYFIY